MGLRVAVRKKMSKAIILLLENEDDEVFIFRRALDALGYGGLLVVLPSLSQARDYLEGKGRFANRSRHPWPQLIVSDSRLDDGAGVDFFWWLQKQPFARQVAFVLYTRAAPPAVGLALVNAGARAFITKSGHFEDTQKSVAEMLAFLPPSHP